MKLQPREQKFYRAAIFVLLLWFLVLRWADIVSGETSTVDALVVAVLGALVLLPLFQEVTIGGVTLREVERAVEKEVVRVQDEAVRRQAQLDLRMIPIWEKEHSSVSSNWSAQKLKLIQQTVEDLEERLNSAPPNEKSQYAIALRGLYWEWLTTARQHWASSTAYQEVKRRVERGFATLAGTGHTPTR